jgi:hypothetical protein
MATSLPDAVDGGCGDADPRTACVVNVGGNLCCGACVDAGVPMLFGDAASSDADAQADM